MIKIEEIDFQTPLENKIEIVERKGLGHPDTICDNIAEILSRNLSKFYLKNFGFIFHHNVDKGVLIGGKSLPKFGGGKIIEPIEIKIVGRAITKIKNKQIPIEKIYLKSAKDYIKNNFRFLNYEKDIVFTLGVKSGSIDLINLFNKNLNKIPLSNDTSFGCGFAPLTDLENLVLKIERLLNSKEFKYKYPFVGEDIKVMGVRFENRITLTIACAFIDKIVKNLKDYLEKKEILRKEIEKFSKKILKNIKIEVFINSADLPDDEIVYLTVTGTSAEMGDDGQIGRGNRVNGLITPYRPMSLEAAAGKNPISHVGKIYNIFTNELAKEIIRKFKEVKEVYVYIVSRIGYPITEPQVLNIKLRFKSKYKTLIIKEIEKLVNNRLKNLTNLWKRLINNEISIC